MNVDEVTPRFAPQLTWPDDRLFAWAAGQIGVPKQEPADSFVLHAPLELMARGALLRWVPTPQRGRARARLVGLVAAYLDAGPGVEAPQPVAPSSVPDAADALVRAVDAGDLDEIDRYATWLGEHVSVGEQRRLLGPPLASSLGAAAHAGIALHLLGRTPPLGTSLLRGAVREVGRQPDWRVRTDGLVVGERPLLDALLDTPRLGLPGSDFIYPMVAQGADAAAALLADVAPDAGSAARAVSRVAAWSMLQDNPDRAPYGWTHCLTIPQAILSLGLDPALAVSVAGTQLIGFRAALGTGPLRPGAPVPPVADEVVTELATAASLHHDAHLVKYTLACFDAAAADPEQRSLYLAAASALAAWWAAQPDDGFFDTATPARAAGAVGP